MSQFDKPASDSPANKEIQDYLDLLLAPTADPVNAAPPVTETNTQKAVVQPKNTKISSTFQNSFKPANREALINAPTGRSRLSQAAKRIEQEALLKPYAEPVKPLTIRMPLPAVQPPPVVEQKLALEPVIKSKAAQVEVKVANEPVQEVKEPELEVKQPEPELEQRAVVQADIASVWMENGRPSWAQERFECLLFTVGGLTLAVPLVELGSIYPITKELTPLFGQIDWFMGLHTVKDFNIRTVNTAKVVMPERYDDSMANNFNYVLSINGVDWGLAVDNVANAITLQPDDVRWRSERSKRPWLAGTVIDHMCALLDVSQLANMFISQDHSRPK